MQSLYPNKGFMNYKATEFWRSDQKALNRQFSKRALILGGKKGLLGQALIYVLQKQQWEAIPIDQDDINIFDLQKLDKKIEGLEPEYIFNTIAYTQVDQAEIERNKAFRLNKVFPYLLANLLKDKNIYFITYSTDFVFDGQKQVPYTSEDIPNPLSVYGQSKLAGEKEVLRAGLEKFLIIRTSWLFGPWKVNFVSKMIELAQKNSSLQVVHDQIGSPTYTLDLAYYTYRLVNGEAKGIYHVSNCGQASWCELAAEALETSGSRCKVQPITSKHYPQRAKRPPFSVLDTSMLSSFIQEKPRPWLQALRDYLFCYHSQLLLNED